MLKYAYLCYTALGACSNIVVVRPFCIDENRAAYTLRYVVVMRCLLVKLIVLSERFH